MKVLVVIVTFSLAALVAFYVWPGPGPQKYWSEPVDFNPFADERSI